MDKTNAQHVRLDGMDGQQARLLLTEMGTILSPERWYALCHEDYVMEMPQSGERFRSRDHLRAFQEAAPKHNPARPSIRVDRVLVRDGLWVKEGVNDYGGGRISHSTVIYELKDGKIWRDTRYFAEPFEAPGWRARWVERMQTGKPDAMSAQDRRGEGMSQNGTQAKAAPNLEAMDERDAFRFLTELAAELSPAAEYEIRHEDYAMEMPQSGERIRGRDNMRAFQESYLGNSTPPSIRIRRVIVRGGLWVVESVVDYGGETVVPGVAILELRDGKVWRDTRYFAEPFEAPAWRSRWVEKMEA